jgi:DNA anti-recombination protein RmuC
VADDIDGLADREIKAGGFKFTFASVAAIFAFISTIVGGLYGGFVLYQKIEEVAGLDLGAYQQQMEVMDAKVSGMAEKVEEAVEYSRDIKNGLKDDILRIEQQSDRVEDTVRAIEDRVDGSIRANEAEVRRLIDESIADIRAMIDAADVRFENQRERVRSSQDADMKELEDRLTNKLQRALDNPLAD